MNKDLLNKKLKRYSAVAAGIAAVGSAAEAQVVYTDVAPDETITVGGATTQWAGDLNADSWIDFVLLVGSQGSGAWTYGAGLANASSFGGASNGAMGTAGPYLNYASNLAASAAIGAGGSFIQNTAGNSFFIASIYASNTYGNFPGQTGFIGVRFDISGSIHYGWIRVSATVGPTSITVMDYAYEATAGTGIAAGDMGAVSVSENFDENVTVFNYADVLNVSYAGDFSEGIIEISNMMGQVVQTETMNDRVINIGISDLAVGVYMVNVKVDGQMTTRKIYVR